MHFSQRETDLLNKNFMLDFKKGIVKYLKKELSCLNSETFALEVKSWSSKNMKRDDV